MLSTLTKQVILNESITTTETRAKEVRKFVDKMVTYGKKGDLVSRRKALAFLNNDKEVVISGDSTFGPVIEMGISEDPWTKKRLYVYLAAYEEGSDYSEEYLKYCPFCGKKLTEIVK